MTATLWRKNNVCLTLKADISRCVRRRQKAKSKQEQFIGWTDTPVISPLRYSIRSLSL